MLGSGYSISGLFSGISGGAGRKKQDRKIRDFTNNFVQAAGLDPGDVSVSIQRGVVVHKGGRFSSVPEKRDVMLVEITGLSDSNSAYEYYNRLHEMSETASRIVRETYVWGMPPLVSVKPAAGFPRRLTESSGSMRQAQQEKDFDGLQPVQA